MISKDQLYNILKQLSEENFELLNEANLQNEIAFRLKLISNNEYKVQLERNVLHLLKLKEKKLPKKHMDIYIDNMKGGKVCIEIKYPKGKSYQKRVNNTYLDFMFLKELKNNGFEKCFSIFISKHQKYENHLETFLSGINQSEYNLKWHCLRFNEPNQNSISHFFYILEI